MTGVERTVFTLSDSNDIVRGGDRGDVTYGGGGVDGRVGGAANDAIAVVEAQDQAPTVRGGLGDDVVGNTGLSDQGMDINGGVGPDLRKVIFYLLEAGVCFDVTGMQTGVTLPDLGRLRRT